MVSFIEKVVDYIVGIISPKAQLKRTAYRKANQRYVAAKTFRQAGDWFPAWTSVNDLLADQNVTIRNRVRDLVRNFPPFKRATDIIVDYVVGPEITYYPRVRKIDGSLNKKLNQKISDAWMYFCDEADFTGKQHLSELMRLAKRQECELGEFILVRRQVNNGSRYIPLAYQIYEPDWLTDFNVSGYLNNPVNMGIEHNEKTGKVIAYHFTDPDSYGQSVRIPAEQVIHGYELKRPTQLRGVSELVTAVMLAHDLGDYMDAEIDAAKIASRYLAFVTTSDIPSFQAGRTSDPETATDTVSKIEEVESALIEYLNPGESVTIAHHDRGGSQFESFVKFVIRLISVAINVPYEILSGDYTDLNYTTIRAMRNDMQKHFLPMQQRHVKHFCEPIKRDFLESAVMTGRLKLPNFVFDPWFYYKCYWQPPGLEAIDPLKEGKADIDRIDSLLMSPQEVANRRGRNYEEVLEEIAEAKRMQEEKQLESKKPSTSTANNPAALMEDGDV